MSNLSTLTSPGSRPLELLKIAELRDELKKRGRSLEGVKKELFERLEEAIKTEEQNGIVHGEPAAPKTGISDGTEDLKGDDEVLGKTKDQSFKAHNIMNACPSDDLLSSCSSDLQPSSFPSNVLPKTPFSTTEEATPISELHALSGVSAPDGVPGFNEDRERISTARTASVGTNNDVLFVDNAVCEDGDAMLLQPSAAEATERGKDIPENHETSPEIATSDLKDSENIIGAPGYGFVVSDAIHVPSEDSSVRVAVDDASGTDCTMHDVMGASLLADSKEIAELTFKSETLLEVPPQDEDYKVSMQALSDSGLPDEEKDLGDLKAKILSEVSRNANVPLADLAHEGREELVAYGRDMIVSKEKSDARKELVETVTNDLVMAGEMEKSDVKMEPMKIDKQSAGDKEVQIDKNNLSQLKVSSKKSHLMEIKFENSSRNDKGGSSSKESRVAYKCRSNSEHNADLKCMENDTQACINLRRKDPDTYFKQQEPTKRMRRWNSGKEGTVDTLKPLTTDTVKEMVLPKSTDGSFVAAQRLTPKAGATLRELAPKVKVEPDSGDARIVPPSTRAPSNSLKIERFVRPFTLKAVKDLLGEFGQCVDFWMDQIKTHCFVTYSSVNEAAAARGGLYGRQWPPSVGHFLVAEFVDANEVKMRSEGATVKAQARQPPAPLQNANSLPSPALRVGQSAKTFRIGSTTLPNSRFSRETQFPPVSKKDPEPAGLTLEDLFFKTKAKPSIYYLPLTDKQVAEKLAAGKKRNRPPGSK